MINELILKHYYLPKFMFYSDFLSFLVMFSCQEHPVVMCPWDPLDCDIFSEFPYFDDFNKVQGLIITGQIFCRMFLNWDVLFF